MLSIQTDKKLSILLPNTNKVLAKVLQTATLDELKSITQNKDLKSVLNSLLKDSSLNSSADKALLSLVKNNPTLKEISNIKEPMKELLNTLKSDKNLKYLEKELQKFLPNIKDIVNIDIKSTLKNSGVFLESKLKDIQNPKLKLNILLNELSKLVQKSDLPKAKILQNKINNILNFPSFKNLSQDLQKESPKVQESVVKNIQNLVKDISSEIQKANPITSEKFDVKLQKLETLLQPKITTEIKVQISNLTEELKQPISKLTQEQIKNTLTTTNNLVNKTKNDLKLQVPINTIDIQKPEDTKTIQTTQVKEENIKLPAIIEAIKDVNITLQTSFTNNSKGFMDALSKVLNLLKNIEQTAPTTKLAIEQLIEKNIPQKISSIITDIKTEIKNSDPIFSKDTRIIVKELSLLNAPQKLSSAENIKDILSNDLKAVLSKVSEEVSKLNPNQNETLKQIDKLNLAIDYHQLVSHLSSSSSLYLPVSWDEMQEGEISIKKLKKDKFYCDIELKLKEYKELRVRLTLYDKNQLNIHISSDSAKLKRIMGVSMSELRHALTDSNIHTKDIRFSNYTKTSQELSYDNANKDIDIGFEVKV